MQSTSTAMRANTLSLMKNASNGSSAPKSQHLKQPTVPTHTHPGVSPGSLSPHHINATKRLSTHAQNRRGTGVPRGTPVPRGAGVPGRPLAACPSRGGSPWKASRPSRDRSPWRDSYPFNNKNSVMYFDWMEWINVTQTKYTPCRERNDERNDERNGFDLSCAVKTVSFLVLFVVGRRRRRRPAARGGGRPCGQCRGTALRRTMPVMM